MGDLFQWFEDLQKELSNNQLKIAGEIIKEIKTRLKFLLDVGLNYLSLNRSSKSLSGGEAQRIRLATQIGSQLVGVLYILDEPSIGLHQRDNERLLHTLQKLRDLGNTVIVVEHDEEAILIADHVIDIGGGATLKDSINAARTSGHISLVGILGGVSASVVVPLIFAKQLEIHGVAVGNAAMQDDMTRAIEAGQIKPVIDRDFDLADTAEAFALQTSAQHFGKITLSI